VTALVGAVTALSLAAIAVPFVVYPAVLWLRARLRRDPVAAADWTPDVDLVICAHDEAASIGPRIENALSLDYPHEQLTVWIASDGSSDGTVAIARRYEGPRVRVLDLPRRGKAAALNAAVEAGRAGIVAFSDANSAWEPGALRALVRPLADPRVGGVAGDQRYAAGPGAERAAGERSYWSFDRLLKRWQAEAGSAISATGAIYAIRRLLFQPAPPDATDDFMVSTGVVDAGSRLAFAPDAVAVEPPAAGDRLEYRRKVRLITRGLRAVLYRRRLLRPSRTGAYAWELLLHKVWRRLTWIPLLVLALLAPFSWAAGGVPAAVALAVVVGVAVGGAGLAVPALGRLPLVGLASYVLVVNAACAVATWNTLRGERVSHWKSQRALRDVGESGP